MFLTFKQNENKIIQKISSSEDQRTSLARPHFGNQERAFVANLSARLKVKADQSENFCQSTVIQIQIFFENYSFHSFFGDLNSRLLADIGMYIFLI